MVPPYGSGGQEQWSADNSELDQAQQSSVTPYTSLSYLYLLQPSAVLHLQSISPQQTHYTDIDKRNLPRRINTTPSRLLQDNGQGRIRLVQCGSRFLTDTETDYAIIELEILAVAWTILKCKSVKFPLDDWSPSSTHIPWMLSRIPASNSWRWRYHLYHCSSLACWKAALYTRFPLQCPN